MVTLPPKFAPPAVLVTDAALTLAVTMALAPAVSAPDTTRLRLAALPVGLICPSPTDRAPLTVIVAGVGALMVTTSPLENDSAPQL